MSKLAADWPDKWVARKLSVVDKKFFIRVSKPVFYTIISTSTRDIKQSLRYDHETKELFNIIELEPSIIKHSK